ncbi:hypothetical protein D1814_10120 [Alteromonas sp. BL110]|uniref:hypothetical protein n=1 Tax=Alteromonas sp. BL110 TaxID=1714845 RepID=UPI000E5385A2|nr:hypothetical protein [Alteromonas sp. BL110]AXT39014.1 hypothetical protein D1814_10120 [Alteromonas sp. BL110]RKM84347.1 hypothetical protein D7031_01420 [Alteromonas sp. BL110]
MNDLTLFEGNDIKVTFHEGSTKKILVSFVGRNRNESFDNTFAVNFGLKNGFSVLAVRTANNHWYQTQEMYEIVKILDDFKSSEVFLYGGSMGGYGAILLSSMVTWPLKVIALSPQFGISQEDIPFDKRWINNYDHTKAIFKNCKLNAAHDYFIVYDNHHRTDTCHVKRLMVSNAKAVVCPIKIPFAGHVVGDFSAAFLGNIVKSIFNSSLSLSEVNKKRKELRIESSVYMMNLVKSLFDKGKNQKALHFLEKYGDIIDDQDFISLFRSRIYMRMKKNMLALYFARVNLNLESEERLRHLISVYKHLNWTYETELFSNILIKQTDASKRTLDFLNR